MAKLLTLIPSYFLLIFFLFHLPHYSLQLQPSQYQAIMKLKQQLNFPEELTTWTENSDFCNCQPTQIFSLSCYDNNITQLHVLGNSWFPKLTQDFSNPALFSNLANFPSLKVLSLVGLGLKGSLPLEIGGLSSLEILNISSNSFNGSIPVEISSLKNLQTLIMDHNRFTGQIPVCLSYLPLLSVLSFRNNSFSGVFPNALSNLGNLRVLVLSGNNLSGGVFGLEKLRNLQVVDLEDNNLGPAFPNLPSKLVSLILRNNKFQSPISDGLDACHQLQKMDVSLNQLIGQFPPSIMSLPSLSYLDIGGNRFTGRFAKNITCNDQLVFVNLTENHLTGELPNCLKSKRRNVFCNGNCFSNNKQQHPVGFCHTEALAVTFAPPNKNEKKRPCYGEAVLASSMVGGVIAAFAIIGVAVLFVKGKISKEDLNNVPQTKLIIDKVSQADTLKLLKDARCISETMRLGTLGGIPPYRTFVLDELREATNNFSFLNILAGGSNGQMYKGSLTDGTVVAIRSLRMKKKHTIQTYTHQLELISKLRHSHLVSSIGHCFECFKDDPSYVSRIFLGFEYVPNGTLRKFISEGELGKRLTWTQRIGAVIGVAKGIQFLHTAGIYSNGLRITDILLDQNLHVKISKCNLPLFSDYNRDRQDDIGASGSMGFRSSIGEKSDVYDFGVILLEIIVGRKINCENDVRVSSDILMVSLTGHAATRSIVDPAVHMECSDDSIKTLVDICVRCLSNEQSQRPTVEDVIWNLQFAAQVQDSWLQESISNHNSPDHV